MGNLIAAEQSKLEALSSSEGRAFLRADAGWLEARQVCPDSLLFQASRECGPSKQLDAAQAKTLGAREVAAGFSPDDEERFQTLLNSLIDNQKQLAEACSSRDQAALQEMRNAVTSIHLAMYRHRKLLPKVNESLRVDRSLKFKATAVDPKSEKLSGLETLLDLLKKAPSLYTTFTAQAATLFTALPPMSLSESAIQPQIDEIVGVLRSIASGEIQLSPQAQTKAIPALLSIALARGDLHCALEALLFLNRLPPQCESPEAVSTLHQAVRPYPDIAQLIAQQRVEFTWNTGRKGPDIEIRNSGLTITRTNSAGWGCNLSEQSITDGVHYVEFNVDKGTSSCLLLGIAGPNFEGYSSKSSCEGGISIQADGDVYVNSTHAGNFFRYTEGDRVGVLIDMETSSLTFYRNGKVQDKPPITPIPKTVYLLSCFGGSDQFVTINNESEAPSDANPLNTSTLPGRLLPAKGEDFGKLPADSHTFKLSDLAAFALSELSRYSLVTFEQFGLTEDPRCEVEGKRMAVGRSILLDLQPATVECLLQLCELATERLEAQADKRKTWFWTTVYALRLLNVHLFASHYALSQCADLPHIAAIRSSLQFYLLKDWTLVPARKTQLRREVALIIAHNTPLLYPTPRDKLDFLEFVCQLFRSPEIEESSTVLMKAVATRRFMEDFIDCSSPENFQALTGALKLIMDVAVGPIGAGFQPFRPHPLILSAVASWQCTLLSKAEENQFAGAWGSLLVDYTAAVTEEALKILQSLADNCIDTAILVRGRGTILHKVVPTLFMSLSLCRMPLRMYDALLSPFPDLLQSLALIPTFKDFPPVPVVYESAHPFVPSSESKEKTISLASAHGYELTFDPRCNVGNSFFQVWLDEAKTKKHSQWTGTQFPRDPVCIEHSEVKLMAVDGKREAWGWRILIVPYGEWRSPEDWIEVFRKAAYTFLTSSAKWLISCEPNPPSCLLLDTPLFRSGLSDKFECHLTSKPTVDPCIARLSLLSFRVRKQEAMELALRRGSSLILSKKQGALQDVKQYLGGFKEHANSVCRFSEQKHVDRFVAGGTDVEEVWKILKQEAGAVGPVTTIGGKDLDVAERAIFAIYASVFGFADRFGELIEGVDTLGDQVNFLIRQATQFRRWAQAQKQKNPSLTYSALQDSLLQKFLILLRLNHEKLRLALRVRPIICLTVKSYSKNMSRSMELSRQKSSDVTKASLNIYRVRSLLSVTIPKTTGVDAGLQEEWKTVSGKVYEFLEDECSAQAFVQEFSARRNKALARCIGLNILVDVMKSANRTRTMELLASESFSTSLLSPEGQKQHYLNDLSGIDPLLQRCVQTSFFTLYQSFAACLSLTLCRDLDCTSDTTAGAFLAVMNALSCKLEQRDMDALGTVKLRGMVEFILAWAKGVDIRELGRKKFDISKCITNLTVASMKKPPKKKESLQISSRQLLKITQGGESAQPIVRLALAAKADAAFGPPKVKIDGKRNLFFLTGVPTPGGKYLTSLSIASNNPIRFEPQFTPYDNLLIPDENEAETTARKMRKGFLRDSAWTLLKLLTYSLCTHDGAGKSDTQLQQMLLEVLFPDLRWSSSKEAVTTEFSKKTKMHLRRVSRGVLWLDALLDSTKRPTNAVAEWVKQLEDMSITLLNSDVSSPLQQFAQSFLKAVTKFMGLVDPTLSGSIKASAVDPTLRQEMTAFTDSEGTIDFFMYVNAELSAQLSAVRLDTPNLPIYRKIPANLAQARTEVGNATVYGLMSQLILAVNLRNCEKLGRILSWFKAEGKPGRVSDPTVIASASPAFLNSDKELDLLTTLNAIRKAPETFSDCWEELKLLSIPWENYPESCADLYCAPPQATHLTASLLWVVHQCVKSSSFQVVLAQSPLLPELIKHAFSSASETVSTISFRIIRKLFSASCSVPTVQRLWAATPKDSLAVLVQDTASGDIVKTLLALTGLQTSFHLKQKQKLALSLSAIHQLSGEALECLQCMYLSPVWRTQVVNRVVSVLHSLSEMAPSDLADSPALALGALAFISNAWNEPDCCDTREWTTVELSESAVRSGWVVSVHPEKPNITLFTPDDGQFRQEPLVRVDRTISSYPVKFFADISSETAEELLALLLGVIRAYQTSTGLLAESVLATQEVRATWRQAGFLAVRGLISLVLDRPNLSDNVLQTVSHSLLSIKDAQALEAISGLTSLKEHLYIRSQTNSPESRPTTTPDRQNQLMQEMNEEQQVLVATLMSTGLSFDDIIRAQEEGHKDVDSIQKWVVETHEKRPGAISDDSILYKLDDSPTISIVDHTDTVYFYQQPNSAIVLQADEPCDEEKRLIVDVNSGLMKKYTEFLPEVSVLLAVEAARRCEIALGTLRIGVEASPDEVRVSLGTTVLWSGSAKVAEVRVFARFDGRVAVWTPAGTTDVPETHPDIFDGTSLCAISLVLPAGSMGCMALKGLALYPNRHTGPCQFWPPEDSDMQVDPQFFEMVEKHGNTTARCLGFTGTPVDLCNEFAQRNPVFIDALREMMSRTDRDQWADEIVREIDLPITDIKALKPTEVMPEGYQVVPGIAATPARAMLIYKRGEGVAVTGINYVEDQGKIDLTLDATDCFPLKLSFTTGNGRDPVTDLLFVTSSTRRVLLPPGYSLLKHKKKAVNFTLKSDPLPLFLAIRSCSLLMGDAAQNFSFLPKVPIQYGLSSEREAAPPRRPPAEQAKEYRNFSTKTTPELFALSRLMEERAIQDLAEKCLYEVAKRHPGILRSVVGSDASIMLKILSKLQRNLKDISAAVRAVISSDDFSRSILPELYLWCIASVCTWRASTQNRKLIIESIHPYVDNMRHDEVITIPGAHRLKITFDSQTRTESGCDVIRFYTEPNHQNLIYEKSGSEFPPLEVEGDTVYLFFYTDGSRVDWGYSFTVEGVCPTLDPIIGNRLLSVSAVTWLLDQCVAEKAAAQFTQREFLYPLLLYAYTVTSTDSRSEAFEVLGQLLALEEAEPRACRSVMAVLAKDMTGLFEGEKKGTVSKLTHTLLNIILTYAEKFALDMHEEWFQNLKKAIAFMNSFTQRFEDLDPVLFRHFLTTKNVSLSRQYEGEHPYRPVTEVMEVCVPGANKLELTLSPETSFSPLHTFYISLDRDGRIPVSSRTVQTNTVAKWKDAPTGPDIAFSNEGLTITRTNSAGWGCAVWNTDYSVGQHRITFFIDNDGNSEHLVFGVAKRRESEISLSDFLGSIPDTWSWRKNGSVKGPAGEQSVADAAFATGDVVSLFLDFDNLTITFCKNGMDVHSFPHTGEVLTPMICFGGSNQFVSSLGVESAVPTQGAFSKFTIAAADTVYCHFPVNVGYATLRGNSWTLPQAVMNMTRSSEGYTRVARTSEPDTCTTIPFNTAFSRGRHYGELEVLNLAESELSFGLAEKGQEWLLEPVLCCSTSGLISALGQTSTCEVFASGDRIGFFANVETYEFAVYKNGTVVRTFTAPLPPGEYNFAVCLKAVGQEVRLVQDPAAPVDLYSPDVSEDGWGFHLTAQPEYQGDSIMARIVDLSEEKQKEWQEIRKKFHSMVMKHSETIAQFIDARCSTSGVDPLTSKSLDLTLTPADAIQFGSLTDLSPDDLKLAFDCLTKLNSMVVAVLPFIIPSDRPLEELNTVQRTFLGCKNLVYFSVKNKFFRQAIALTNNESRESILVDRTKAMKWKRDGKIDTALSVSVFSQLCLLTNYKDNTLFRSSERIYRMTFAGEGATDAGGPYNETMSTICDELQSQLVPLLTPTQNNKHGLGEYRDAWIPNPASNSEAHLKHFRFLGKILGVAIRTQNNLNLSFPPLFWKRLIQDRVTVQDLKGVDEATFHMLEILRDPEKAGLTKDSFADAFNDVTFTYADSSGNTVELLPNGGEVPVTYENAAQYADLVEQLRLNESAEIYGELRKGMGVVVPSQLLRLFSWKQTEALVCGAPDIDVDLLMKKTSYSSWNASDRQVQDLWTCLREFTPQQRCMFLRFVWGRSRLPASGDFRNMTINKLSRQQPDNCLPVAHTCSFGFDLAEYSSIDILRSKVLYAITQCQGIDLDGLAGGGWVDDE